MSPYEILHFNSSIGEKKPKNITNHNVKCPFCDRDNLENILDERGPILLLKNKYPVLEDTLQTVIVETYRCTPEFSDYPKEHLYNVISFGIEKWLEMESSNEFSSVIYYKNHGPYSGGTISHPHMQIIGLKNVDYHKHLQKEQFEGLIINKEQNVEFNIATKPRAGFDEFNVILKDFNSINKMADYIQIATHYSLNHYHKHCNSYNLFFYHIDNKIAVKIVPRFVTSPLFVGFSIPQVSDNMERIALDIKNIYL
ncbi:MAG: DUF4931 domain-containing protein [Clostridia bacterium]|nr:DUF4931 domain-containing protein [Clostridia bacterium]MDD4048153.1 DUF4931 domain-containing protein [Clostridia bacterium]